MRIAIRVIRNFLITPCQRERIFLWTNLSSVWQHDIAGAESGIGTKWKIAGDDLMVWCRKFVSLSLLRDFGYTRSYKWQRIRTSNYNKTSVSMSFISEDWLTSTWLFTNWETHGYLYYMYNCIMYIHRGIRELEFSLVYKLGLKTIRNTVREFESQVMFLIVSWLKLYTK